MGLFDSFGGDTIQLTPKLALAVGMLYLGAADGRITEQEIHEVLRFVPDRPTLDAAVEYNRRTKYPDYLKAAARTLTPEQKLCLIVNAADMAMGDGYLAPEEQKMLIAMAQAFQLSDAQLNPYIQTLMIKNNRSLFG